MLARTFGTITKATTDSKGIHLMLDLGWEFREVVMKVMGELPCAVEVTIAKMTDG